MDEHLKHELDTLIDRFKNGERELLTPIVEMIDGHIYSFLHWKGIPPADLPDVVSVFLQTLFDTKIDGYKRKRGSTFWNWLCTVMSRTAIDWHRSNIKRKESPRSDLIALLADPEKQPVEPPSPRMQLLLACFARAFTRLSRSDQELMKKVVVEKLTYDEIIEDKYQNMDTKTRKRLEGGLRTRMSRAKQKIRDWMKADPAVPKDIFVNEREGH